MLHATEIKKDIFLGNLPINQSLKADTEPLLKLCLLYRVLAAKYFMVFQVLVSQKNSEKYFFLC